MTRTADVLVTGIVVADHVAAPIDRLPGSGELVLTDDCLLTIGGSAGNVAVDLAKVGVASKVCGCVGDDAFGRFAADYLERHDVDASGLRTVPGTATSQTLILNVKGEDRRFVHHRGANDAFRREHISEEDVANARLFYIGGLFLMDGLSADDVVDVLCYARDNQTTTVLDLVTPGPLDYETSLKKMLPYADLFLPNSDEGKLITGLDDPMAQAEAFHSMGAQTAVVTCGEHGSVLVSDDLRLRAAAYPSEMVDGTGGGDAFDAGYMLGLLEGLGPVDCLTLGSALGASCVRRSGATDGVFNRAQLDEFVKHNQLRIL